MMAACAGFVEQLDFDSVAQHPPGDVRPWNRVDLTEGCIPLDEAHSKNGKPRRVYLSPSTTALLVA